MRTVMRYPLLTTAVLSALTVASCTHSSSDPSTAPAPARSAATAATSEPVGTHWVHDRQLRQVMARLTLQKPSMPSGMPQEPESPKTAMPEDFDTVAMLASELMTSAEQIPNVARNMQMQEADRSGFIAEANTLRDQAQRLRDAARRQRIEQMQRDMDAINATCISCHSRYRDLSGQLNTAQTSASPIPGLQRLPANQ